MAMQTTCPLVPPPLPSSAVLLAALDVVGAAVMPSADAELRRVRDEQRCAVDRDCPDGDGISTPFHSSAVPHLTLAAYARHVANATGYGAEGLAVGLALMARYDRAAVARAAAAAAAGSADNNTADVAFDATLVGVTALTMHRLFATCMQLGMKTASDHFVKNAYVAPLVGMTLAELNALELELAVALDFRCHATCAEMCELPCSITAKATANDNVCGPDFHARLRRDFHRAAVTAARHHEVLEDQPALPGFDDVDGDARDESAGISTSALRALDKEADVAAASLTATYSAGV